MRARARVGGSCLYRAVSVCRNFGTLPFQVGGPWCVAAFGSGVFPSEKDTSVASHLGTIGAGMLILWHDCSDGYLVSPPTTRSEERSTSRCWALNLGRWRVMAGIINVVSHHHSQKMVVRSISGGGV
jgi:hypothetical protein